VLERIGRYEIVERIGIGAMGTVYRARDPHIQRDVAIKQMRDGIDSADARNRFLREVRAAGGLSHPNIVAVFDSGEEGDRPFVVMELVEGETLSSLIARRAQLSLSQRLDLIEQLCTGLEFAHRAQLVHRDIKPANLIVDRSHVLKILDFGLARIVGTDTASGVVVGTMHYMSPEQWSGKGIDQRSDIFAVGCVVYELLTYRRAFNGDTVPAIYLSISQSQPADVDVVCPDLPSGLSALVRRLLAKRAEDRYQSLGDVVAEIRDIRRSLREDEPTNGPEVHAAPQRIVQPASSPDALTVLKGTQPSAPNRRRRVLAATVVVTLAIGGATYQRWRTSRLPATTPRTSEATTSISPPPQPEEVPPSSVPPPVKAFDSPRGPEAPILAAAKPEAVRIAAASPTASATPQPSAGPPTSIDFDTLLADALAAVSNAKDTATKIGVRAIQSPEYAAGVAAEREAESLSQSRSPRAITKYYEAQKQFLAAASAPVPPVTPPVAPPVDTVMRSPEPPPTVTPSVAIARAINAYRDAYQTMDVGALLQIYPTFPGARDLQKRFDDLREVAMALGRPTIQQTSASTATATCTYSLTFTSKNGRAETTKPQRAEFRLRADGEVWIIESLTFR
jgi:serine/threonine-protein kinase